MGIVFVFCREICVGPCGWEGARLSKGGIIVGDGAISTVGGLCVVVPVVG